MLMPSIFGENLFDDFFDYPFVKNEAESNGLMKTDVKDTEHGYEITMNLPGVKKEDVKAALKDGYLTISATSDSKKEEKNDKGQYIYPAIGENEFFYYDLNKEVIVLSDEFLDIINQNQSKLKAITIKKYTEYLEKRNPNNKSISEILNYY